MKILFCSTDLVPQNRIFCYNERKIMQEKVYEYRKNPTGGR